MSDNELSTENVRKKRVPLKNIEQITKYMAKKTKEFENDPEQSKHYRTAGFMVGKLIDCIKVQKDLEIEKRLIEIEKKLGIDIHEIRKKNY